MAARCGDLTQGPLPSALAWPSCPGILASWHPGISRQIGLLKFYTTAQLAVATKGAAFRSLWVSRITSINNMHATQSLLGTRRQERRNCARPASWHLLARERKGLDFLCFSNKHNMTVVPICQCEDLTGSWALQIGSLHGLSAGLQSNPCLCVL